MQPPIPKQVVLAIDPGFRTGCKVAVLDRSGNLLDQAVIYPHPPQNRRSEAKVVLKDLVGKHQVGVVAIGNGTACRETEELVAEIIAEGTQFSSQEHVAPAAGRRGGGPSLHREPDRAPLRPGRAMPTAAGGSAPSQAEHGPTPEDPGRPARYGPRPQSHQTNDHDRRAQRPAPRAHEAEILQPLAGTRAATSAGVDLMPRLSLTTHARPRRRCEMLPPISGASPDATSPEAEIDVSTGSPSPAETGANRRAERAAAEVRRASRRRPRRRPDRNLRQPRPDSRAEPRADRRSRARAGRLGRRSPAIRPSSAADRTGI